MAGKSLLLGCCAGSAGLELAAGKDGKAVDSAEGHFKVSTRTHSWTADTPACGV
jgi:hypothetical protein